MKKRGETNIGGFIALIAFFLLVYVILLNPTEKQQLFGTEKGIAQVPGSDTGSSEGAGKSLLSVTPGFLRPDTGGYVINTFPTVELFSNLQSETVNLAASLSATRSLFNNNFKEFEFKIEDPKTMDGVNILFFVLRNSGNLVLSLNDKEFFNGKVGNTDLPIMIPKNLLRKNNVLRMEASSPGLAFLSRNFYDIKDLQLVIKTLKQNKRELRSFVIAEDEYGDLQKARLLYFINCLKVKEVGLLNIFVNDRLISTRFVVCDAKPVEHDIDVRELKPGRNDIRFEMDKGEYALEQVVLEKQLKQKGYPQYYFAVQRSDIDDISSLVSNAVLKMEFSDDGYRKSGTVLVNGARIYFDTYGPRFEYDLSNLLREGENLIKIIPKVEIEVLSLDVVLE